jgi:hypothetical protein
MNQIKINEVTKFVNENIESFHRRKIVLLGNLELKDILKKKNPYLFKAKNIAKAQDLIENILDAFLSSSEEKEFGDFLEDLAVFIAGKVFNGGKSSATGIDLEFNDSNAHYLVSIKSGPNWGNSSQQKKQEENFNKAVKVLKQSRHTGNIQTVLGICYGKVRTSYLRGYMKVVGQNFWYLISRDRDLYTDIIEPLGYNARQHNEIFLKQKDILINQFSRQFMDDFCENGAINWKKLVEFNSGNFDLDNI